MACVACQICCLGLPCVGTLPATWLALDCCLDTILKYCKPGMLPVVTWRSAVPESVRMVRLQSGRCLCVLKRNTCTLPAADLPRPARLC